MGKKLLRFLKRLILLLLVVVLAIIVVNTISFSSRQIQIDPVSPPSVGSIVEKRLSQAVQIPTITEEGPIDSLPFRSLHHFIDTQFVLVDSMLERHSIGDLSLVFKWAGKNPDLEPVLLLAHMDVVPVDSAGIRSWTHPPFSGHIDNNYIWGRGTLDDKVSVLGILEAAEMLLKEGYYPQRTVFLAFGHDEETGGKSGAKEIAAFFKKEGLSFEYILDEGSIILEKPMAGIDLPVAFIGITEKGATSLDLKVSMDGGHSSMPPPETVIGILSSAVHKLEENPFPPRIDGATKAMLQYLGPEMPTLQKGIMANLWLFEGVVKKIFDKKPATSATMRTTTAPTILKGGVKANVLPVEAKATVNFRILPGESTASVIDYVQKTIDDPRVEVLPKKGSFSSEPSPVSGTNTFGFEVVQKTVLQIFPETLIAPSLVIAGTDARHYTGLSNSIYRFLPVRLSYEDLKRIHGNNERISKENYRQAIRFYYQLIKNSCK